MVLFLFIIMLLDLKKESSPKFSPATLAAAVVVPLILVFQVSTVIGSREGSDEFAPLNQETLSAAAATLVNKNDDNISADSNIIADLNQGELPDVNIIGQKLFTHYNFPLQMVGFLLLVATVGCICLSKKIALKPVPASQSAAPSKSSEKTVDKTPRA